MKKVFYVVRCEKIQTHDSKEEAQKVANDLSELDSECSFKVVVKIEEGEEK